MLGDYEHLLERIRGGEAVDVVGDYRLAREEFHNLTGHFDDGEPWYELRMHMFMDWYLLERPGPDGLSPTERYLTHNFQTLADEDRRQLEQLACTARSVFCIAAITGDHIELTDIVFGGHWEATITIPNIGLNRGDLLSARVALVDDQAVIGRGVVLHPKEARSAILAIILRAQDENMPARSLVDYIDKMRLKYDRYSNVKVKHVYKYPSDAVF